MIGVPFVSSKNTKRLIFALLLTIAGRAVASELPPNDSADSENCSPCTVCDNCSDEPDEEVVRRSLLDTSHGYVTGRFDSFARWLDGFFGKPGSDSERAYSFVRLRYDTLWEEGGGTAGRVRVRGRVRLPLLNEKLKLVFSDEEEEQAAVSEQSLEDVDIEDRNREEVALEYSVEEQRRFSLDYRLGMRSGNEIRTGIRMRYKKPLTKNVSAKVTEDIFWQDTRGFGSRTIIDFDYNPRQHQLLRWSSRLDYTEDREGVPWTSILSMNRALDQERVVAYYFRADGETRPDYLTTSYGPGILYRINVWKKWLFFELEPTYSWRKSFDDSRRRGVAAATFRVEVVFSEEHTEIQYPR